MHPKVRPMMTRRFDPTLKNYCLDTSTLSYAAVALSRGSSAALPGFSLLVPWIEKIAYTGNLVVSFAHVAEIGDWPDSAIADALAKWLDSLPLV
jgi:hypothetical protein